MKTTFQNLKTKQLHDISFKNLDVFPYTLKFYIRFILLLVLFASCRGTIKSVKIAREKFKTYKIPESLYKDEWGMTAYKLYNPTFNYGQRQFIHEDKNEYKLIFSRWCKGNDELGNVKKLRLDIFFNIKQLDNDTYVVSEVGIEKVLPLKFGRQFLTWLGMIIFGLLIFWSWKGYFTNSAATFIFVQIAWYTYVGFISYNCFMSGWGILLGILMNVFLVNLTYLTVKNK